MTCGWCGAVVSGAGRRRWCSKRCRQTAWRARKVAVAEDLGDTPKRLAYADPPYPGLSRKYYSDHPDYAGEVDHAELVSLLQGYDGWALSTSAKALRDVLPLCPPEARVAAWVKPNGADPRTRGPHSLWEPVIYVPARFRRPGRRDWLSAKPARGGGTLMGRKPIAFCGWMFGLLGAAPVDELDDLFPGTGVVSRCWEQFRKSSGPGGDAPSARAPGDGRGEIRATSRAAAGDASPRGIGDTSRGSGKDAASR